MNTKIILLGTAQIAVRTGNWLLMVGLQAICSTLPRMTARVVEGGPVKVVDGGNHYKVYPVAWVARQIEAAGKAIRPEQRVRVLYSRGKLGVRSWDALEQPDSPSMDIKCNQILL